MTSKVFSISCLFDPLGRQQGLSSRYFNGQPQQLCPATKSLLFLQPLCHLRVTKLWKCSSEFHQTVSLKCWQRVEVQLLSFYSPSVVVSLLWIIWCFSSCLPIWLCTLLRLSRIFNCADMQSPHKEATLFKCWRASSLYLASLGPFHCMLYELGLSWMSQLCGEKEWVYTSLWTLTHGVMSCWKACSPELLFTLYFLSLLGSPHTHT